MHEGDCSAIAYSTNPVSQPQKFQTFIIIWCGQFLSLLGSVLTSFALGIWVYQKTGSATQFALISAATFLPRVLFSPIAGVIVDRWDPRKSMILSDVGAALSTAVIAALFFSDQLAVWHIYVGAAISSAFGSFQWPAYTAITTLIVPKKDLTRAQGLISVAQGAAYLSAPAIAGVLINIIDISGIIAIDIATFLFALICLILIRLPVYKKPSKSEKTSASIRHEATEAWQYVSDRPGLMLLQIFVALINLLIGIWEVLTTPLILSFSNSTMLGLVWSVGGLGTVLGSLTILATGGGKDRVRVVVGVAIFMGFGIFLAGLQPIIPLIMLGSFLILFFAQIGTAADHALWQTKIPLHLQGRVFAHRQMIDSAALLIAFLIAGPLADYVFKPMFFPGGLMVDSIGLLIGVGEGRGIGFLFSIMGIILMAFTIIIYFSPRIKNLDKEIPDVIN